MNADSALTLINNKYKELKNNSVNPESAFTLIKNFCAWKNNKFAESTGIMPQNYFATSYSQLTKQHAKPKQAAQCRPHKNNTAQRACDL